MFEATVPIPATPTNIQSPQLRSRHLFIIVCEILKHIGYTISMSVEMHIDVNQHLGTSPLYHSLRRSRKHGSVTTWVPALRHTIIYIIYYIYYIYLLYIIYTHYIYIMYYIYTMYILYGYGSKLDIHWMVYIFNIY